MGFSFTSNNSCTYSWANTSLKYLSDLTFLEYISQHNMTARSYFCFLNIPGNIRQSLQHQNTYLWFIFTIIKPVFTVGCMHHWLLNWSGADPEILKRGALYVSHHGWPTKKVLGFRWPKKAKITLETISFWQNIYISILKFSPFLYSMKAFRWNLFQFIKIYLFTKFALIKKEKK